MKTVKFKNGRTFPEAGQIYWPFGGVPTAGNLDIDLSRAGQIKCSISGTCNYTLINGSPGEWYFIRVEQDVTPQIINFVNVDFGSLPPPDHLLCQREGDWTVVAVYCDGAGNYCGTYGENFLSTWF